MPNIIMMPALMTDADQFAKPTRAEAHSKRVTLEPHRPGSFDPFWSSPLVSEAVKESIPDNEFRIANGY
jgi:hypothetical protein